MSTTITGRDPGTGTPLEVEHSGGRITALRRPGESGEPLPWLVPGLVDIQVNGFAGHDVNAARPDPDHLRAITAALAARGVTTWVPTVITGTVEQIHDRLVAIAQAIQSYPEVAGAIPFVHVEGPFLSDQDGPRGVHDLAAIRPIDAAEVASWSRLAPIGYVTVSPHWPDAPSQIAAIVAGGVRVAVGHTHASGDQIRAAVDAGASLSTHLGNGIFAQLPRHPNPIWTQLADDRLTCGLIGDGHHLPADTFTAMVRALGPGRAVLVSDAVELAGSAPGRYRTTVGGEVVLTPDGKLAYPGTGLLAGSAVSLADCLHWVATRTPLGLATAVALATRHPGRVVEQIAPGWTGGTGTLRVGQPANLCLLDDRGQLISVLVGGERP